MEEDHGRRIAQAGHVQDPGAAQQAADQHPAVLPRDDLRLPPLGVRPVGGGARFRDRQQMVAAASRRARRRDRDSTMTCYQRMHEVLLGVTRPQQPPDWDAILWDWMGVTDVHDRDHMLERMGVEPIDVYDFPTADLSPFTGLIVSG